MNMFILVFELLFIFSDGIPFCTQKLNNNKILEKLQQVPLPYNARSRLADEMMTLQFDSTLVSALNNRSSGIMNWTEIIDMDVQWKGGDASNLYSAIYDNPVSNYLKNLATGYFLKFWLIDYIGVLVAASGPSPSYWLGNDKIYQDAYNYCQGGIGQSAIEFNSNGSFTVVSFPIIDPVCNCTTGVVAITVALNELLAPECKTSTNLDLHAAMEKLTRMTPELRSTLDAAISPYLHDSILVATISSLNNRTFDELLDIEHSWRQNITVLEPFFNNNGSARLREIQQQIGDLIFTHIFLTDASGGVVAMTTAPHEEESMLMDSDPIFLKAFNDCQGGVYTPGFQYDNDYETQLLRAAFPVLDQNNIVRGTLHFDIDAGSAIPCDKSIHPAALKTIIEQSPLPLAVRQFVARVILPLTYRADIVDAVEKQNNREFTWMDVYARDRIWTKAHTFPFIDQEMSVVLQSIDSRYEYLNQILLMDHQGVNVASSNTTTAYYHGDQAKFQNAFLYCDGGFNIDPAEYDPALKSTLQHVSLPVLSEVIDTSLNTTSYIAIGALGVTLMPEIMPVLPCDTSVNRTELISAVNRNTLLNSPQKKIILRSLFPLMDDAILRQSLSARPVYLPAFIKSLDLVWANETQVNYIQVQVYQSSLALYLQSLIENIGPQFVEAIFLVDIQGALVAATRKTNRFDLKTNESFFESFNECNGGIWTGDQEIRTDHNGFADVTQMLSFPILISNDSLLGVIILEITDAYIDYELSIPITVMLFLLGTVLAAGIIGTLVLFWRHRNHPILKNSGLSLRIHALFGLFCWLMTAFLFPFPTDATCQSLSWLFQIGFVTLMTSIVLIAWQIYSSIDNKGDTVQKVLMNKASSYVVVSLLWIFNIVLLVMSHIHKPTVALPRTIDEVRYVECSNGNSFYVTLIVMEDLAFIIVAIALSRAIRKVAIHDYRYVMDRKQILFSVINCILISLVFVPAIVLTFSRPWISRPLFSLFFISEVASFMMFLFWKRVETVWKYPDPDRFMKDLVGDNKTVETDSTHLSNISDSQLRDLISKRSTADLVKLIRAIQLHSNVPKSKGSKDSKNGQKEAGHVRSKTMAGGHSNGHLPSDMDSKTVPGPGWKILKRNDQSDIKSELANYELPEDEIYIGQFNPRPKPPLSSISPSHPQNSPIALLRKLVSGVGQPQPISEGTSPESANDPLTGSSGPDGRPITSSSAASPDASPKLDPVGLSAVVGAALDKTEGDLVEPPLRTSTPKLPTTPKFTPSLAHTLAHLTSLSSLSSSSSSSSSSSNQNQNPDDFRIAHYDHNDQSPITPLTPSIPSIPKVRKVHQIIEQSGGATLLQIQQQQQQRQGQDDSVSLRATPGVMVRHIPVVKSYTPVDSAEMKFSPKQPVRAKLAARHEAHDEFQAVKLHMTPLPQNYQRSLSHGDLERQESIENFRLKQEIERTPIERTPSNFVDDQASPSSPTRRFGEDVYVV